MPVLYNLARMSTATTGTGTITLGSAVTGYLSFATAGVADGETVSYGIADGNNREAGRGVYTASGTTLTRSVLDSTNGGAAISLSGSAQVFIAAVSEDFDGQWLELNRATAANDATIDFTLPAGFEEYMVTFHNVIPATDVTYLHMRTSTDGGSNFDAGVSDYRQLAWGAAKGTGSRYWLTYTQQIGSDTNEFGVSGSVSLFSPSVAAYCKFISYVAYTADTGAEYDEAASGYRVSTTAINAIRFAMDSGNVESGEFVLLGRRK